MKAFGLLFIAACVALLTTGCNTVEGFGRDVEHVGNKLERKADDERRY